MPIYRPSNIPGGMNYKKYVAFCDVCQEIFAAREEGDFDGYSSFKNYLRFMRSASFNVTRIWKRRTGHITDPPQIYHRPYPLVCNECRLNRFSCKTCKKVLIDEPETQIKFYCTATLDDKKFYCSESCRDKQHKEHGTETCQYCNWTLYGQYIPEAEQKVKEIYKFRRAS